MKDQAFYKKIGKISGKSRKNKKPNRQQQTAEARQNALTARRNKKQQQIEIPGNSDQEGTLLASIENIKENKMNKKQQNSSQITPPEDNLGRCSNNLFVALYDFYGAGEEKLSLKKGDQIEVLSYNKTKEWCEVKLINRQCASTNSECNGRIGLVPSHYIAPTNSMDKQSLTQIAESSTLINQNASTSQQQSTIEEDYENENNDKDESDDSEDDPIKLINCPYCGLGLRKLRKRHYTSPVCGRNSFYTDNGISIIYNNVLNGNFVDTTNFINLLKKQNKGETVYIIRKGKELVYVGHTKTTTQLRFSCHKIRKIAKKEKLEYAILMSNLTTDSACFLESLILLGFVIPSERTLNETYEHRNLSNFLLDEMNYNYIPKIRLYHHEVFSFIYKRNLKWRFVHKDLNF